MNALWILGICLGVFFLAYRYYGSFLETSVFEINSSNVVPSKARQDGQDFVPSKKGIVFGHHFTSIAGTGPIVGPAIGIIWGWIPALLWVLLGSVFIGAVHDFGSLVVSLRSEGESIAQCANRLLGQKLRFYFFALICFALLVVIAIFGLIMAVLFDSFPESVFPVWAEIPIAIGLGLALKNARYPLWLKTFVAVFLMYVTVYLGHLWPLVMPEQLLGIPATGLWTIALLVYAFIASILRVTTLLQPRDYINAWQLYIALLLIFSGVFVSGFSGDLLVQAPGLQLFPEGAPSIWPFLGITIACGAVSGFHSLVSSGTTSKQLSNEKDAKLVGYGSMILEGLLAVLVIIAVTAGLGLGYTLPDGVTLFGLDAWNQHYSSWGASAGLQSKLQAVVMGFANILEYIGISKSIGAVIIGVFIASFAGTTLDTSTRIQRYMIIELTKGTRFDSIAKPIPATLIAVISALFLAFSSGLSGKGALLLWPLFGAVNQLLAALALLVVSHYLFSRSSRYCWVTLMPGLAVFLMSFWAIWSQFTSAIQIGNIVLFSLNGVLMIFSIMIAVEFLKLVPRLFYRFQKR